MSRSKPKKQRKTQMPFLAKVFRTTMSKTLIVNHTAMENTVCFDVEFMRAENKLSKRAHDLLTRLEHPWSFALIVTGVDSAGNPYLKIEQYYQNGYFQPVLENAVTKLERLGESFNQAHMTGMCWIASVCGFEIDDVNARQIMQAVTGLPGGVSTPELELIRKLENGSI